MGETPVLKTFSSVHVNLHKALVTSKYRYAVITHIPINRMTE